MQLLSGNIRHTSYDRWADLGLNCMPPLIDRRMSSSLNILHSPEMSSYYGTSYRIYSFIRTTTFPEIYETGNALPIFLLASSVPNIHKEICNNITVMSSWARWRLKSPASRLFTQSFIQAEIKENIKAPRHWPLRGIHRWPLNSPHK